jgi:4-hydroxyproline epimerase
VSVPAGAAVSVPAGAAVSELVAVREPAVAPVVWPDVIRVIDSHTEGEPTRVVVEGWPQPRGATMAERRDDMRERWDHLRRAVICEPRGHEAMVGALLTPSVEPGSAAGVIFFNNVGYLGMCGHGLVGVARTLAYLGRLEPGEVRIDTPVGTVSAMLECCGIATIRNVASRVHALDVAVDVPGLGTVVGDVAYGGNWFFITELPGVSLDAEHVYRLTELTQRIMDELARQGITGENGAVIDHLELIGPARRRDAHARNFVLCPGGVYDRSPCGTGTSAKLACLHARGELSPCQEWRQEGVAGGLFSGWLEERDGELVPWIRGRAFVTGASMLRFDPADPFRAGIAG